MFSWNCQRSNGTHLTYCMDRFYFGSCCKLPPGVYIATPPPISSNDVTDTPKSKPRPSLTERFTTEKPKFPSEEKYNTFLKPSKVPSTEFPPGLVTWRPLEEVTSTQSPPRRKPTKLYSTKPLFDSSTTRPKVTEESKPPTRRTRPTSAPSESSTTVTKRKTRPTRPYGVTSSKRKPRPTKPYGIRNSTSSRVSMRRTKPTRPYNRPTKPSTQTSLKTTESTPSKIGTWANILDRTTKPLPFPTRRYSLSTKRPTRPPTTPSTSLTSKTTEIIPTQKSTPGPVYTRRPPGAVHQTQRPATAVPARRPTPVTVGPVRKPTPVTEAPVRKPTPVTIAPVRKPTPVTAGPVRRPTPAAVAPVRRPIPVTESPVRRSTPVTESPVRRPTSATVLTRRPTIGDYPTQRPTLSNYSTKKPVTTAAPTRRPSRPTVASSTTLFTTPSTTPSTTARTTTSTTTTTTTTRRPEIVKTTEITFPPFPGITRDSTTQKPYVPSVTVGTKRTTLRPKPTTVPTSSTERSTTVDSVTAISTTEKTTPSQDYTKGKSNEYI